MPKSCIDEHGRMDDQNGDLVGEMLPDSDVYKVKDEWTLWREIDETNRESERLARLTINISKAAIAISLLAIALNILVIVH